MEIMAIGYFRTIRPLLRDAQFVLSRISSYSPTTRHILMDLQSSKEKTLTAARK